MWRGGQRSGQKGSRTGDAISRPLSCPSLPRVDSPSSKAEVQQDIESDGEVDIFGWGTPTQIKEAMQDAVGAGYLDRFRSIRYNAKTPHNQRLQLECQEASQAVKARTSHMRWQASLVAVDRAHQNKDVDKLMKALTKCSASSAEPRVKQARSSLAKWQARAAKWLPRAQDAMECLNMPELYKAVNVLDKCPLDAVGSEQRAQAKSLLSFYEVQQRNLRRATETADASCRIRTFLRDWEFDLADTVVIDANIFLMKREDATSELRAAIIDKDFTDDTTRLEAAMSKFLEVIPRERIDRLKKRRNLGLMVKQDEATELDAVAALLRKGLAALEDYDGSEYLSGSESQTPPKPSTADTSHDLNEPFQFEGEVIGDYDYDGGDPALVPAEAHAN